MIYFWIKIETYLPLFLNKKNERTERERGLFVSKNQAGSPFIGLSVGGIRRLFEFFNGLGFPSGRHVCSKPSRSDPSSVFITTLRTFSTNPRVNPSGKPSHRCVKLQSTSQVYAICGQSCQVDEWKLFRRDPLSIFFLFFSIWPLSIFQKVFLFLESLILLVEILDKERPRFKMEEESREDYLDLFS